MSPFSVQFIELNSKTRGGQAFLDKDPSKYVGLGGPHNLARSFVPIVEETSDNT